MGTMMMAYVRNWRRARVLSVNGPCQPFIKGLSLTLRKIEEAYVFFMLGDYLGEDVGEGV